MGKTLNKTFCVFPFLAVLVSCLPMITHGFPQGHDWLFETVRMAEYSHAAADGQSPPYWGSNLYGGYGSPIFLYYAPLFVVLASFCARFSDSFLTGGVAATLLLTLVAAYGCLLLVRQFDGKNMLIRSAARVAAYFYVLHPYLIGDKLLRNAYAEFAGLCFLPLAVAGILRIKTDRLRGFIILSFGFGLTIISHNLTALVAAALLAVIFFCRISTASFTLADVTAEAGGMVMGLLLAAFFWVPALFLKNLVSTDTITGGKFDFHNQFQPLSTFFSYEHFFSTGFLTPAILVLAILVWIKNTTGTAAERRIVFFLLAAAFVCLFLQLPASTFLWENLPFMAFFQFPWRLMGPVAFASAILAGFIFKSFLHGKKEQTCLTVEMVILLLCAANALPALKAYKPLPPDVSRTISTALLPQNIKKDFQTATVLNEYVPKGANPFYPRFNQPKSDPVVNVLPPGTINVIKDSGTHLQFDINSAEPVRLKIARWYFPGWQATANGAPVSVGKNQGGALLLDIDGGRHRIDLKLKPPLLRTISIWLSTAGLGCLLLAAAGAAVVRRQKK